MAYYLKEVKMKRKLSFVLLLSLAVSAILASPALGQQSLSVDIGKTAKIIDGGQAVELKVKTVCAIEGFELLEAFVYVTQNGNTSQFASIPVSCSDIPRPQKATVRVLALDFLFQEGEANASAFILLIDPVSGDTLSTSPTQVIRIR
jgi:hypothetical protein